MPAIGLFAVAGLCLPALATTDKASGRRLHGSDGGDDWNCTDGLATWQGKVTTWPCTEGDKVDFPPGSSGDKDGGSKDTGSWGDKDGSGGSKEQQRCTPTSMGDPMDGLTRSCIAHPSHAAGRCWWTYVPSAVASATDGRKVSLVVDMHGGGGCASDQMLSSGWRQLADSEAAAGGGMVVVWPQGGPGGLWASHGSSDRVTAEAQAAKDAPLPDWNDIDFLQQLVANAIAGHASIDPEKVFVTGFSYGCMMAQRFALESSKLVAGVGCHGGELSFWPANSTEMDADKTMYSTAPMPAYLTIGDLDGWYPGCRRSWEAWKYWNGCTADSVDNSTSPFVEHISASCELSALQTVMLEITGLAHIPDTGATGKTWAFLKSYRRAGAATASEARAAVEEIDVDPDTSQSASSANALRLSSSALTALLFLGSSRAGLASLYVLH